MLGIWDGEWVVIEDTEELPPVGDTWQVFSRPGDPIIPRTGGLTGSNFYCDPAPYERPVVDFGNDWPWLAVQAEWPLVPHKVEDIGGQLDVYIDAVMEVLAQRGLEVDTAYLEQLVRFDLEGDGVDEVIVIATEGERTDIYTPATDEPFEIVILRKLVDGEVQTAILELRLPDLILGEDGFPFLNEFEVIAVADLSGDGKMEIAIRDAYYEGAGLVLWEFIDDDIGFLPVLGIGCGA